MTLTTACRTPCPSYHAWDVSRSSNASACPVLAPDGTIDRIVEMPVSNVTTCTFGGPELKTLYITTAMRRDERLSGGLFRLEVDVPGLPENVFRVAG